MMHDLKEDHGLWRSTIFFPGVLAELLKIVHGIMGKKPLSINHFTATGAPKKIPNYHKFLNVITPISGIFQTV